MTISTTRSAVSYVGNGVTTSFDFTFPIPVGALVVTLTEAKKVTPLAASAYTATGLGGDKGGAVTLATPPTAAQTVTIRRLVDLTQETSLVTGAAFYAEVVESTHDRHAMADQQLQEQLDRAVKVPVGSGLDPDDYLATIEAARDDAQAAAEAAATAVPQASLATIAALRASVAGFTLVHVKGYRTPGDGGEGIFRLDSSDTTSADDGGSIIVTTSHRRYKREFGAGPISVKQFGAAGDGTTADTYEFQQAAAVAANAPIYVPAGTYLLADYLPIGPFYGPGVAKISVEGGTARTFTFPKAPGAWKPAQGLGELMARMAARETIRIACYGDSQTDGNETTGWTTNDRVEVTGQPWTYEPTAVTTNHNDAAPQAWPKKLQDILRAYYATSNITVWNCGYSGQRICDGWANTFFERTIPNRYGAMPDLVFIAFGANDAKLIGSDIADHLAETEKLIRKIIGYGAVPVLLTSDANWQSVQSWTLDSNGYENTEISRQIDAAKIGLASRYGIPLLDLAAVELAWLTQNSDGHDFFEDQNDGLHFGDAGHAFKAMAVARSLIRDLYVSDGVSVQRIHWMDSRSGFTGDTREGWSPSTGDPANSNLFLYSRFPRIWNFYGAAAASSSGANYAGYTAGEIFFEAWIWVENRQPALIYRGVSNQGITTALPNESDHPQIQVAHGADLTACYYIKAMPNCGANEIALHAIDRPYYCCRLKYGLNRIRMKAPATNSLQFWGGWFELNPGWLDKSSFGWFRNSNSPNQIQINALKHLGGYEMTYVSPAAWSSGAVSNPVSFVFPEAPDGSNTACFGNIGDSVDLLIEGTFETETGLILFGGASINTGSGSGDGTQEDTSILLYVDPSYPNTFNLHYLRYPFQTTAPFPIIALGTGTFSSNARKFMVRCARVAGNLQNITIYDGWADTGTVILSWAGNVTTQLPAAGVIGGVFCKRTISTTRTIKINQLLIRKTV